MTTTADGNADALSDLIRTEFRTMPLRELLNESPRALLGVTPEAETVLQSLEISTIFDLATSGVFNDATTLMNAGMNLKSALYQHGAPTADLVREAETAGKQIGELQFLPIKALERIPDAQVDAIQNALDVQTIRDLALYPPFRAAVRLMNEVYFPENVAGYDPERPADLLPKTGDYPTERVQYSTLVLDEIPLDDGVQIIDVASKAFKPIDLLLLAQADAGFKKTAFGALLTFNQSWYAQGVTLGQLLHSMSLAPGESTRIAVVDWSRKSRAGETEIIDETDDLTNDQTHNRSIGEVTQAVANEAQGGFSATNTNSHSTQSGSSSAEELSAPFGGLFGGPSGSFGQTSSQADSSSHADSYSSSWGNRELGSVMSQNINDRTHQHAHSNRSRRASVVKEVSQSEHEGVSTRVIANYNHMHALTIQYYEVVQVYRVEVAVVKVDRVVFIPFKLIDFNNDNMIRRFQNVLARAALTYEIRQALNTLETLEVTLDKGTHFSVLGDTLQRFATSAMTTRTSLSAMTKPAVAGPTPPLPVGAPPSNELPLARSIKRGFSAVAALSVVQQMNEQLWRGEQASRLAGLLNLSVLRPTSNSLFLPTDVLVEGASVEAEGAAVKLIFRDLNNKVITNVSAESPVAMSTVGRISLSGSSPDKDVTAEVVLTLNRNGVRFPVELPAVRIKKGTTGETRLVQIKLGGADVNLKKHLMDNRMHYSQAVFRSLDATQTAFLLSNFGVQVNGQMVPVAQVVEPRAIRVIGNYLAFKMNSDVSSDEVWAKWLKDHGIHLGVAKETLVPLATGGTFAEAILGRSNCAEKLDITRFWNWQDSPIPLQPTEIAAIQTGSRATDEDVKPGQLSNPIVNITSPTSLPDPMGTAAILAAIQNGNMFRDMSGLQATIGLAQAALQATAAGASTAGEQAGTNMNNLLKANTERQRIAAEMITSLAKTAAGVFTGGAAGGGGGGISGGGNHSQDGAKINYFDKNKAPAPAPSGSGSNGGGGAVSPASGGGASSGGVASNNGATVSTVGSEAAGWSQNPGILAATWGDGVPASNLIEKAMAYGFADTPVALQDGGNAGDAGVPWLQVPTVAVATSQSDKTDLTGSNDKIALADADFDVSGVTTRNWRMNGVEQFGDGRIDTPMRQLADITGIVLHETVGLTWSPPTHPASVHMHIERDGAVVQHNQFFHRCNHARTYNASTIGIEHVNTPFISDPNKAPADREGEVVDIKWGNQQYLSLPTAAQLEACNTMVVWLRSKFSSIPATWPQLVDGSVLFDSNKPEANERWFLVNTKGHNFFAAAGINMAGIASHSALIDHEDGASLALYTALRNQGLKAADAVTAMFTIFADSNRYRKVTRHGITVHAVRVTDFL